MHGHQRFVAHIDILGMSALVSKDAELAWQLLSNLVEARNKAHTIHITFIDTAQTVAVPDQIRAVTFSDTILLFTKGVDLVDLRSILVVTTELLSKALNLCVPIRVGISVGTFFFNLKESMYAGPALIEAYQLGEEAQWIGIVVSEEVHRRATEAKMMSGKAEVVIRTNIPLNGRVRQGYAVNWPAALASSINAQLPVTSEQVYEGFAQYFGPYDQQSERVKMKYENTALFINARDA